MNRFDIAKAHAKNRSKIKQAITQMNRSLNQAIKDNKKELEDANIRMLIILHAAYLESTLPYLLYFYGAQIKMVSVNYILSKPSEYDKWVSFIEYCFRRNFLDGKRRALNLINLKHTNYQRYIYLKETLDNDIRAIIEIRNKLAHGQWAIAFNSEGDSKNQEVTSKIWTLSKKDVLAVRNVVLRFTVLMESLISSGEHFQSSFDTQVGALEENKLIHEQRYDWIIDTIKSRKRPENV